MTMTDTPDTIQPNREARRHKRVVIYVRISKSDTKVGVARQRREALAYAADHPDWEVVLVLVDNNRSALEENLSKRPNYRKLRSMIESDEVDIVLVFHADRITRNSTVGAQFVTLARQHKVNVHTSGGTVYNLQTADGRKHFTDDITNAVHESEHKGERVGSRTIDQIEEGMLHGGTRPYGFHRAAKKKGAAPCPSGCLNPDGSPVMMNVRIRDGVVVAIVTPCPIEQDRLRWFAEALARGASYYEMAAHANTEGWPTAGLPYGIIRKWADANGYDQTEWDEDETGIPAEVIAAWKAAGGVGMWYPQTVKKVLTKPATVGRRGAFPTMPSLGSLLLPEQEESLAAVEAGPKRTGRKITPTLLGALDILKCHCGANLQARGASTTGGKPVYGCVSDKAPGYHGCGKCSIIREGLERVMDDLLVHALAIWKREGSGGEVSDADAIAAELLQAKGDLQDCLDDQDGPGRLPREMFQARKAKLVATINALDAKLALAFAHDTDEIPNRPTKDWWGLRTPEQKRKILQATVESITVAPGIKGKPFNPERITLTLGDWITDTIADVPTARKLRAFTFSQILWAAAAAAADATETDEDTEASLAAQEHTAAADVTYAIVNEA